jgi:uncharacterized protein (DUF4213/DUF364 family)
MSRARERTIGQAVAGGRFCAVVLDDGGTGVANLCPDVCGRPARHISDLLPQPGTPAAKALETPAPPQCSAIGLATANALANRFHGAAGVSPDDPARYGIGREAGTSSDVLDELELGPDDHVGMVGCFHPLVGRVRRRAGRLTIFERGPRLSDGLLPEDQATAILPECSVALITATAIINGTIDGLLAAARGCREVVLLGPSTPLVPEVFNGPSGRVTLLAGVVVADAAALLRTVTRDGGTRDFMTSVIKVNVRVNRTMGEHPHAQPTPRSRGAQAQH